MVSSLLSVSWKEHSCELAAVCKNLLAEDFLVDCTIAAEGQKLKAHRLILSACSPYFRMLFNEEAEKNPIVILKDTLFDLLKAVVDFMYHGETQIPEDRLQAFLQLAENLQIKGLNNSPFKDRNQDLCRNVAVVNISPSLSKDNRNTYEVQGASASHEDSAENSSQPLRSHLYPSDGHTDAVQSNAVVSCEKLTESCEEVQSASEVSPPHEQRNLPDCEERFVDVETIVKQEPLYSEFLETNTEGLDDIPSDDPMSGNFTNERDSGTTSAFGGQDVNQFPTVDVKSELAVPSIPDGAQCVVHCEIGAAVEGESPPLLLAAPSTQLPADAQSIAPVCPFTRNLRSATVPKAKQQRMRKNERPHVCNVCGAAFKRKETLTVHSSTHTGLRPLFRCDVCGLCFPYRSSLKYHKTIHTGERPFRCDVCGKSFRVSSFLTRHKRCHAAKL